MKLIHVTDLHLRAAGIAVAGLDPLANLEDAIADINRHHADAFLVVFSGDLADDGSEAAYRAFAGALDRLETPYRLMLGNHDSRRGFAAVFPDLADDHGFVQSATDGPAGRIVCLDTLDEGSVSGRLCTDRLAFLDRALAGTDAAFVFLHHPPFAIGMPPLDDVRLANPDDFAAIASARGTLRHLFAGHVHRLASGSWNGLPFATGRGTNHQSANLIGADDFAVSYEAPSYNIVLIDGANVTVHAHEYPRRPR